MYISMYNSIYNSELELNKVINKQNKILLEIYEYINNFIIKEYIYGNIYPIVEEIKNRDDNLHTYWKEKGFIKLIEIIYDSFINEPHSINDSYNMSNESYIYILNLIRLYEDGNGDGYDGKIVNIWCKYYVNNFVEIIKKLHRCIINHLYIRFGDSLYNKIFKSL